MNFETVKIKVSLNGLDCKNPKIILVGYEGNIYVNCINEACGEYEVQFDNTQGDRCFTFSVTCSNCTTCKAKLITKCLCDTNSDCPDPCDHCDNGVCNPKCTGGCEAGICLEGCIECVSACPDGKICTSYIDNLGRSCRRCGCPPGKKENIFGDCVDCLVATDCPNCFDCLGQTCQPKNCGTGVCDPANGKCEECVNSGDCGTNKCCVNKKCVCCTGYVLDLAGNCVPKPPCIEDDDCGSCEVCKNKVCVPKECPPGQACDDDECKQSCDCNNPASCGTNKVCRNKGNVCVCESCGACVTGCAEGCIDKCAQGQGCVVNPCTGNCTNGANCGPGCGCNTLTGKCESCSLQTCSTNCGNVLGCECAGSVCNKPETKCVGGCDDAFDCGPGCTCYLKKCVPCSYFSCNNSSCSSQDRCKCLGNTCGEDQSAKCNDTLEIIKHDDTCTIDAVLTTAKPCGCSVITVKLSDTANTSGASLTHTFLFELFKGNNTDFVNRLDQTSTPGIATNETPLTGSVTVKATVNYSTGIASVIEGSAPLALVGYNNVALVLPSFNYNHGTSTSPKFVTKISFLASMSETTYPNTCEYVPVAIVSTSVNDNTTLLSGTAVLSSSGTKLPLFTYWKSANGVFSGKLKDKYVSLSGGVYKDTLVYPEAESCYDYKVKADCGCADDKAKKIVFCSPSTWTVTFEQCNKTARIDIPGPCLANRNSQYILEVDGANVKSFLIPAAGIQFTETRSIPIKNVKLKLVCDTSDACTLSKNAPPLGDLTPDVSYNCNIQGIPTFIFKGDYTKVKWNDVWNPMPASKELSFQGVTGVSYPYVISFTNGCSDYNGNTPIATCCASLVPTVEQSCETNKYVFGNIFSTVSYSFDGTYADNITYTNINNTTIFDAVNKVLYYKSNVSDSCFGTLTLPAKLICCSTVTPEITQSTGSIVVKLHQTSGTGNYRVSISPAAQNPQTILNLVVNNPQSVSFNGLSNATYDVIVTNLDNLNCGVETRSVVISDCNITTQVAYNQCNIEASTTGTCACKDIIWKPEVLNVVETASGIDIIWESNIYNQDAAIISGTISVGANAQSYNVNAQGYATGIATIPCTSAISKIGTIVMDFYRGDRQGAGDDYLVLTLNTGFNISSVTINSVPAEFFNGNWRVPDTNSSINDFTVVIQSSSFITITTTQSVLPLLGLWGISVDLYGSQVNCPPNKVVTFKLTNLQLEDNCVYGTEEIQYVITGTTAPTAVATGMVPVNRYARYPKYIWLQDNTVIKSEFNAVKSSLSGSLISIDRNNEVYTSCTCDSARVTIDSCLTLPTFSSVTSTDCGSSVDFVITGGCYNTPILVNIGSDTFGPFNYNPTTGYTGTISLSAPITDNTYIYGKYTLKNSCQFNALVNLVDYEVSMVKRTCGVGLGSLTSCASTEHVAQIVVKKNGVVLAYDPLNYSINSLSPAATIVTYNNGSYIGCLTTATQYTFNVVASGCTLPQTYTNVCSGSCSVSNYDILVPTGDDRPCITDTQTAIQISNVNATGTLEYSINGGGFATLTQSSDITFTYNVSPVANTVSVRKQGETGCEVERTFFITERDCSSTTVDCNVTSNRPTVTLTGSTSGVTGCKTLGGSGSTPTYTISGATSPYSWQWSTLQGTATFGTASGTGASIASTTITYVAFSVMERIRIRLTVTSANGCSTSLEYVMYNNNVTCVSGSSSCPSSSNCASTSVCCPTDQCNGTTCCATGTTPCGSGVCCPSGQVCYTASNGSKSCKNVGDPCGTCSGTVLANGTCSGPTCTQGRECCANQCLYFNTDANCGTCGNSCGSNQDCCLAGSVYQCTSISSSSTNCGGCGNVCTSGASCVSGVCNISLGLSTHPITDYPCKFTDNSGFCISTGTIATEIPNTATNIAVQSYVMSYGSTGSVNVTSNSSITTTASLTDSNKIVVKVKATFSGFRVPITAVENNIVTITYKVGNTNYKGTFSGGSDTYTEWNSSGQNMCSGSISCAYLIGGGGSGS